MQTVNLQLYKTKKIIKTLKKQMEKSNFKIVGSVATAQINCKLIEYTERNLSLIHLVSLCNEEAKIQVFMNLIDNIKK